MEQQTRLENISITFSTNQLVRSTRINWYPAPLSPMAQCCCLVEQEIPTTLKPGQVCQYKSAIIAIISSSPCQDECVSPQTLPYLNLFLVKVWSFLRLPAAIETSRLPAGKELMDWWNGRMLFCVGQNTSKEIWCEPKSRWRSRSKSIIMIQQCNDRTDMHSKKMQRTLQHSTKSLIFHKPNIVSSIIKM